MTEPFERDEGTYATVAQALLRGELPYHDLFDHKPPLIYVWYALSFTVFGETIVAPRLMAALVWSLTAVIVYKQGSILVSEAVGRKAALLFALSSSIVLLQASANTEAFMLLPLTASLFGFTMALKTDRLEWFAVAGLCGGIAVVTKQVAGVNLAVAGLILVVLALKQGGWPRAAFRLVVLGATVAVPILLALLPFLITRSLDDFIYANWTYNRLYASELPLGERLDAELRGLRLVLLVAGPLLVLGIAGSIAALRRMPPLNLLLVAWLAASYTGVLLSGRAFPHYYVPLLPPLGLLATIAIHRWQTFGRFPRRLILSAAILTGLFAVAFNGNLYLQPTPEAKHAVRFSAVNPEPQNHSAALGGYIRRLTTSADTIYNYGRETQLYFYADRRPASRFIYDRPFWLDPPTFAEAMAELRFRKPALIVDSVALRGSPNWTETHPAALRELLRAEYEYVGRFEFADLYRLR